MREIGKDTKVKILKEQFIPDHVFLYVVKGAINFFDKNKKYTFKTGDYGIARKNSLLKFVSENNEDFEPVIFCFDEEFLKNFQIKHKLSTVNFEDENAVIELPESELIHHFIQSIKPYHKGVMQLDEVFEDLKYEELLLIFLQLKKELKGLFFNYDIPGKIDLEEFMNRNFKFNVSNERLAFLTGRSISSFKRDFRIIFDDTPSNWLTKKRLQEAHFLITQQRKNASEIFLDLGFENLSHFSFVFKKMFGVSPSKLR